MPKATMTDTLTGHTADTRPSAASRRRVLTWLGAALTASTTLRPAMSWAQSKADPKSDPKADYKVGDRLPASGAKPGTTKARELRWDDLMPKDWDPAKAFQGMDLNALQDNDPRANAAMDKLKEAWKKAPANPAVKGLKIRMPGFIVPLELGKMDVSEFLLVPYFGACIHTPPPPANQVIHVTASSPFKAKTGMDAVWVEGVLEIGNHNSVLGDAAYLIRGAAVSAYKP